MCKENKTYLSLMLLDLHERIQYLFENMCKIYVIYVVNVCIKVGRYNLIF